MVARGDIGVFCNLPGEGVLGEMTLLGDKVSSTVFLCTLA